MRFLPLPIAAASPAARRLQCRGQPRSAPRPPHHAGRQCFYAANVTGFRQGPGDIIYVNTNARDYYEFKTLGYCAARLDFENAIALRSRGGGFICSGYDAEIYVPDALGPTYCPVRSTCAS